MGEENLLTLPDLYEQMGIKSDIYEYGEMVLEELKPRFEGIDRVAEYNQLKVLRAMQEHKVSAEHFNPSSGYGYDDAGRDTLEAVYASVFHTEAALVRPQIVSGTHALAVALFGILRPGDELLSIGGKPYDTMEEVIGIRDCPGSLKEFGVTYAQAELFSDGTFDYDEISDLLNEHTKMILIQRSKGYQTRPSFSVNQIGEAIAFIREKKPDAVIMVDNCYGEFVDVIEPSDVGADIVVGSLIKNPGGGLAETGGYIVGREELIRLCSYRLTAPGIGKEVGANFGVLRNFYQGLFLAPTVVASALKGAIFAASVYEKLGFHVIPAADEERNDIIQAIEFGSPEGVIAFCKGIQEAAPVDSYVTPEGGDMPGYEAPVIMAAGAFVQGASIELSADGPLTEPYAVYFQGGLTWQHAKYGILRSLQEVNDHGVTPPEQLMEDYMEPDEYEDSDEDDEDDTEE